MNSIRKILLAAARFAGIGIFLTLAAPQPREVFANPEMSGTTHKVHRSVTAQGGNRSTSGSHILGATAGEPISGLAASTSHKLAKGFWSVSNYPGTITTLVATSSNTGSVLNLSWVAPGADGTVGIVSKYVVKYSSGIPIGNEVGFATATTFVQNWIPSAPFTQEFHYVTGLTEGVTYYFSVKATTGSGDCLHASLSTGNVSALAVTPGDFTAPSAITNLTAMLGNAESTVRLTWTAPGDNGLGGTLVAGSSFTVQYTTDSAYAGWSPTAAQPGYAYRVSFATSGVAPSSQQTSLITGLTIGTTYYFRMWTSDESGNYAAISNGATSYAVGFQLNFLSSVNSQELATWADLNNDGLLDILTYDGSSSVRQMIQSDPQSFSNNSAGALLNAPVSIAPGDFNNDGRLDFAVSDGSALTRIYANGGGGSFALRQSLASYRKSAWGDFNNDGQLDLAVSFSDANTAKLYKNSEGSFAEVWESFPNTSHGQTLSWADLNRDGRLDLSIGNSNDYASILYGGAEDDSFSNDASLAERNAIDLVWADFNNDGSLDVLIANSANRSKIIDRSLNDTLWTSTYTGALAAAAGDYDNDGDTDFVVVGTTYPVILYRNDGSNAFTEAWKTPDFGTSAALADYDSDGYLDILIGNGSSIKIYKNNRGSSGLMANTAPSAPAGLTSRFHYSMSRSTLTFLWDGGSYDGSASSNSLHYNLVVTTSPMTLSGDSSRIVSPSSFTVSPVYGSPLFGNHVRHALQVWPGDSTAKHGYILRSTDAITEPVSTKLRTDTTYYFRVQTIDAGLSRSIWSAESVAVSSVAPSGITDFTARASTTNATTILLSWTSPGDDGTLGTATRYIVKMATAAHLSPAVSEANFNAAPYVNSTSPVPAPLLSGTSVQMMEVTGLTADVNYYFAIKAQDDIGLLGPLSNGATAVQIGPLRAIENLSAAGGSNAGTVNLNWTWPQALPAGSTFYIQYSTGANHAWSVAGAQLSSRTAAVLQFSPATHTVAGLDIGIDGSNADISPTYYFRLWVSTGAGAYSGESNGSTTSATLPSLPTTAFTDYGASTGWQSTLSGAANLSDQAKGVAKDGSGNIYVTGFSTQTGSEDLFVRKFDSAGNVQWTKFYNNSVSSGADQGLAIAADGSGNVYVTGFEDRGFFAQNNNILVRKYDTNGLLLWATSYNSPASNDDKGNGIALDGSGNVYVAGYEARSDLSQFNNIWVRKYDPNGLILWTTTYNSPSNGSDAANAIAVDSSGNVYVTGNENRTDLTQGLNIWVTKYDTNALLQWTTTYTSAGSATDQGLGIAVDASGNSFVAGSEFLGGGGLTNVWVRKYNPSGQPQWTSSYNSPNNNTDRASAGALDGAGNFYVAGIENRSDLGQGNNIWIRKYDSNGLVVWTTTYNSPANADDTGFAIVVDSANVYAAGYENRQTDLGQSNNAWVRKYVQNKPIAPSDLSGVAQSTDTILWTWTDNSSGFQYQEEGTAVLRSTSGVILSTMAVDQTSYTLTGLTPNASATIRLQSFNVAGTSVGAASAVVYSSANIPLMAGTTFPYIGATVLTAQWLANGNPSWTQFIVEISTWDGFAGTVTSSQTYLTSVSTTGLELGSTYFFRVKARNGNGVDTPYLHLGSVPTYSDVFAPAAITNLTAMLGNSESTVRISWTAPGDDTLSGTLVAGSSFTVQYTTDSAYAGWSPTAAQPAYAYRVSFATSGVAPSSQQTSLITGLTIGTTYYFRMWTSDESGNYAAISNGATSYSVGFEPFFSTTQGIKHAAWADLNNDGLLDILSYITGSSRIIQLLQSDPQTFTASNVSNISSLPRSISPVDYNNDGFLDVASDDGSVLNLVFKNNRNGTYTYSSSPAGYGPNVWGDFNNDGLSDVAIYDFDAGGVRVYRNRGDDSFALSWTDPDGNAPSDMAWGDYDNDGLLDLLFGNNGANRIYKNNGNGSFSSVWSSNETDDTSCVSWGDYDNDGDLDHLASNLGQPARVYRNDGNATFTLAWSSPYMGGAACAWGDYDNDGKLDLTIANSTTPIILYRNIGNDNFSKMWQSGIVIDVLNISLADYDNDGDLDILAGEFDRVRIYKNNRVQAGLAANAIPSAPSGQAARFDYSIARSTIVFKWDPSQYDGSASSHSLYYNLAVATQPMALSGDNLRVTSPSSFTITPVYGTPLFGNYVRQALKTWPGDSAAKYGQVLTSTMVYTESIRTKLLTDTSYYYRVQTIDAGLRTSVWSGEFVIVTTVAPSAVTDFVAQTGNSTGTITLAWTAPGDDGTLGTATRFIIKMSTTASQSPALSISNFNSAMDVNSTSTVPTPLAAGTSVQFMTITGLLQDVTYYFAIRAVDEVGTLGNLSNAATAAAQTAILSVIIDSDTYNFGAFTAVQSTIAARAIVVTNNGNVPERYYIRVQTATPSSPWSIQNARGIDQIAVNALFNSTRPSDGNFEAVQSTMTISNQLSGSGGGNFAGDQTGDNVARNAARNLWFRLGMPTSTSSTAEQEIQVTITAEQSP